MDSTVTGWVITILSRSGRQDRAFATRYQPCTGNVEAVRLSGWCNCLANPVALNSVFVPRDPAAGFLLRDRETIFNFQRSI
jgi:hypothetical protein